MTNLIQRAERLLSHDRSYYLRLCAWCNRALGFAGHPAAGSDCEHSRQLSAQARGRSRDLRRGPRFSFAPSKGPWFGQVLDVGLTWEAAPLALQAVPPCSPPEHDLRVA